MLQVVILLFLGLLPIVSNSLELDFHGFGTVGYAASTNDQQVLLRDQSQYHGIGDKSDPFIGDSRVGLQENIIFNDTFSAMMQEVYAPRIVQSVNDNIQWAFVNIATSKNTNMRIGRVGTDIFALTDQRNVGFSYNFVRPPTEIYNYMPVYSIDGADFVYSMENGVSLKLFGGLSHPIFSVTENNPGQNSELLLSPLFGSTLSIDDDHFNLRLSYVNATERSVLPDVQPLIAASAYLAPVYQSFNNINSIAQFQNSILQFYDFNFNYDNNNWWIYVENTLNLFSVAAKTNKLSSAAAVGHYVDFGTLHVLPFIMYSRAFQLKPTYQFSNNTSSVEVHSLINIYNYDYFDSLSENQYTATIGAKFEMTATSDVKLQMDYVHVFGYGSAEWQQLSGVPYSPETVIFSATMDWMF